MSDVSLKMIRRSCVKEQAYLPLSSPESPCVCKEESKGSCSTFESRILYCSFSEGFFLKGFPAFLRKDGAKSIFFRFIYYGLKCFFGRFKPDRRFPFCFQYLFHKSLVFSFFFNKEGYEIMNLLQSICRKPAQHLLNVFYLCGCCFHKPIISQKPEEI